MAVAVKRLERPVDEDRGAALVRLIRILGMDFLRRRSRLSTLIVSFDLFCDLVEYEFARRRSENSPVLVLPEEILHPLANDGDDIYKEYLKQVFMADYIYFNMRLDALELKIDFFAPPLTMTFAR